MFADLGISDELAEKIVAFVDREAGRDAPLTDEDEAMVVELLEHDAAARNLADDLRATNAGLDTLLDDVAAVEVPDKLVALIRAHAANNVLIMGQPAARTPLERVDDGVVVEHRHPLATIFSYRNLAAAASFLLVVGLATAFHFYTIFQAENERLALQLDAASQTLQRRNEALAAAVTEGNNWATAAEQARDERDLAVHQLAEAENALQSLEIEQADLQGQYDDILREREQFALLQASARAKIEAERKQLMANLDASKEASEMERADADARYRSEVTDLTDELASKQQRLAELSDELESTLAQSATNSAKMRAEQQALQSRLTALEADHREQVTELDAAERAAVDAKQKVASLQGNLVVAEHAKQATVRRASSLEADLAAGKNWLSQLPQYHRIYASTARRHLVEVGADEKEHIEQWLGKMLNRPIPVPDLSAFGVTFAGARLLGINEKPVAQLVYLDADDQPLALCITLSDEEGKEPTASTNRDLNLIDWRDGQYGYAIVGWSNPELLVSLTRAIRPIYDL